MTGPPGVDPASTREPPRVRAATPPRSRAVGASAVFVSVSIGLVVATVAPRGTTDLAVLLAGLLALVLVATGAQRALLGILIASLPFQFGINVAYQEDAAALGALGGVEITVTTVALAALWLLWLADLLVRADVPALDARAALPFGVFVGVAAVAAAGARQLDLAVNELALLVESLLVFTYLSVWARRRPVRVFVAGCFLLSGVAQALMVIGGRLAGGLPAGRVDPTLGSSTMRSGGTIGSPNTAGTFFAAMLIVAFALAISPLRGRLHHLALVAAPVAVFALVLTSSRGAWVGTAVGLTIVGVAACRCGWVDAVRVVACAAVALAVAPIVAGPVIDRLTRDDAGALEGRGPLVSMTLDVVAAQPILGVGPNNLGPVLAEHELARDPRTWVYTVHNKYLLVWAETGFPGLLALAGFLVWSGRRAALASRSREPLSAAVGLGSGAAIAAMAVHMLVEPFNSRPQVQTLVVIAAVAGATAADVALRETVRG